MSQAIFPIPGLFGAYVKKEDAREFLSRYYKFSGLVPFATAMVLVFIEISVRPKLVVLYTNLGLSVSFYSLVGWLLVVAGIAMSLRPFFVRADFTKANSYIAKHKKGEMISFRKLASAAALQRQEYYSFGFVIVMVLFVIFTIIQPIYQLTNSI